LGRIKTSDQKNKKYIKKFSGISVREKSGVKICKNVFGIRSKAIFDPVFNLKKKRMGKNFG